MIAVEDNTNKFMLSKRLAEAKEFKESLNDLFQENTSTIELAGNGKLSSGKRTLYFGIRLFHVTDLIGWKEVTIKNFPTGKMLADYFSKPLVGKLLHMMRSDIMSVALREQAGRLA